MDGQQALKRLMDGNARFAAGEPEGAGRGAARREETVPGQDPFAIILSCADSRVPPEIVFDQGIGDLFVVRVAGNVLDDLVTGSIEYAAAHLSVPLIMVLGHNNCGAVNAAFSEGEPEGHTGSFINAIRPLIKKSEYVDADMFVDVNVEHVTGELKKMEPVLRGLVDDGKLLVVGAHYDLSSGKVEVIG